MLKIRKSLMASLAAVTLLSSVTASTPVSAQWGWARAGAVAGVMEVVGVMGAAGAAMAADMEWAWVEPWLAQPRLAHSPRPLSPKVSITTLIIVSRFMLPYRFQRVRAALDVGARVM